VGPQGGRGPTGKSVQQTVSVIETPTPIDRVPSTAVSDSGRLRPIVTATEIRQPPPAQDDEDEHRRHDRPVPVRRRESSRSYPVAFPAKWNRITARTLRFALVYSQV